MGSQASKNIKFSSDVPLIDQVEVLVIGGGPAGSAAALAAARVGAQTALVEQYGFLGGAATAGLVGPFMTSFSGDGRKQIIGGVFDEVVRRMEALGGATHPACVRAGSAEAGFYVFGHDHVTPFDPEACKFVLAEMMTESQVRMHMHSHFVAPLMEGNWLRGAVIHNKSGLQAIAAKVAIDCTGDGDVAFRAGVPMTQGRAEDGRMQPLTMFFRVGGVDDGAVEAHMAAHPEEQGRPFHALVEEAKARGAFPILRDKIGLYRTGQRGVWRINTTRLQGLDGADAADLTRAELEGRRQVWALMRFFRERLPGFQHAVLLDTATQIGVRQTRSICGEYRLTAEDLIQGRHFPDVIALGGFPFDLHPVSGAGGGTDSALQAGLRAADVYEIPYRALVPQKVEQLLVAGRCLSATHEALGAVRVMPTCFAMGQAAGVAGALAVSQETAPREVNVAKLQATLCAQGAILSVT